MANCCNPILGDDVFGFITVNRGVKVHKKNCSNAVELRANYSYRILKAQWVDGEKQEFETDILIRGIDRKGLVKDITDFLSSNANIEMKGLNFKSIDGVFEGNISMIIDNKSHLEKIIHGISHIDSVRKVKRSN